MPTSRKTRGHLKWWQIRNEDFAVLLYILVIPRVLVLGVTIIFMTVRDTGARVFMTDVFGWNLFVYFQVLTSLSWLFLLACAVTAFIEKPYGDLKWAIIFAGMATLLLLARRTTAQAIHPFI